MLLRLITVCLSVCCRRYDKVKCHLECASKMLSARDLKGCPVRASRTPCERPWEVKLGKIQSIARQNEARSSASSSSIELWNVRVPSVLYHAEATRANGDFMWSISSSTSRILQENTIGAYKSKIRRIARDLAVVPELVASIKNNNSSSSSFREPRVDSAALAARSQRIQSCINTSQFGKRHSDEYLILLYIILVLILSSSLHLSKLIVP